MRYLDCPPINSWITVHYECKSRSLDLYGVDRIFLQPKETSAHKDGKWIRWVLEPGEWYEINNIWYPNKVDARHSNYHAVISLKLNRSKKGRKWVFHKMTRLAQEHIGTDKWNCTERIVNYLATDLNKRVIVASTMEEAIRYSQRILGEEAKPQTRWDLIET